MKHLLCQNCRKNPATIHLTTSINGHQTAIDLCSECYGEFRERSTRSQNQPLQDPFGFNSLDDLFKAMSQRSQPSQNQRQSAPQNVPGGNGNSILGRFGLDLTEEARNGRIDPVIGRDKEISRVIEILNRRTKNNPVLIGEAGVGKTAVVEGLAQKIVDGDVPQKLLDKRVIRLDVVSLVQGTGYRGQFEERMQQLMSELKRDQNTILFIDEIHEIVGAGDNEGRMDAGNVLKPARLQPVRVDEPSTAEAIEILKGIKPKYEAYHHVKYTEEAINAAVLLSSRYIQDRFLPDKAIDLLDEAGSKKNLTIHAADPKVLDDKISHAEANKQAALKEEDYEKAAYYRDQVNKFTEMKQNSVSDENAPVVSDKDMEAIVEEMTQIPVGELKEKEQNQLRNLADSLKKHVIGQDEAVTKTARAIRRNRVGFNKSNRPIGSFLFVGPTGVGKTETAKQLAEELFGSKDSMIRFDMSEYMEKFSVSKLIGSPPGYVGYEEAGQLTEQVRRHPYSLILLDEIEKAHPDVMHMFLQILDDGRLTDSKGQTVSFKDTIIIMTSNAGSGDSVINVGFGAEANGTTNSILDKLSRYFKPEFLNRFDDIIEFNALSKDDLGKIVDLMLQDVNKMLQEKQMSLSVTRPVCDKLVELGYDKKMGARPLRRTIQEQIEDKVTDFCLEHPSVKNFAAKIENNQIVIAESTAKS